MSISSFSAVPRIARDAARARGMAAASCSEMEFGVRVVIILAASLSPILRIE
jgi:hypothetical protein